MLQRVTASYPVIDTWSAALALLDAEEGRRDEALRRARSLCPGGVARVRRDVNRVITLAVLAELAFALRDVETAAAVHDALRRYAGRQVGIGMAVAGYGAVDRYLGLSAATLGRLRRGGGAFRRRRARGSGDGRHRVRGPRRSSTGRRSASRAPARPIASGRSNASPRRRRSGERLGSHAHPAARPRPRIRAARRHPDPQRPLRRQPGTDAAGPEASVEARAGCRCVPAL